MLVGERYADTGELAGGLWFPGEIIQLTLAACGGGGNNFALFVLEKIERS